MRWRRAVSATMVTCVSIAWAQLSPGKLSEVHAHLDGLKNCTQCHVIGAEEFAPKCLDCHQLLRTRIANGTGLHANDAYSACETCHTDHHGRSFALIFWQDGQDAFDHDDAGWKLEGSHAGLDCRACHQAKNIQGSGSLTAAGKGLDRTFLGLSTNCVSCHSDPHQGQFDQDCMRCHTTRTWSQLDGFDHGQTAFSLKGAHQNVSCESCHPTSYDPKTEQSRIAFKGIAFARCGDCHQDAHLGQFTDDCDACHNLDAFSPAPGFDHRRAAFQLTGRHRDTRCAQCHPGVEGALPATMRFKPLPHNSCQACHEDVHRGRLGADCASCHSAQSWRGRPIAGFDHNQTAFALRGNHAGLECTSCHPAGQPIAISQFDDCSDCHSDEHNGQFHAKESDRDCDDCHDLDGFAPSVFGIDAHNQSRFPLTGAHLATPCILCHEIDWVGSKKTRRYHFADTSCRACHDDPHQGVLDSYQPDGCRDCHTTQRWDQLDFNHNVTTFPLEFAHAQASCRACHNPINAPFSGLGKTCNACHEDVHRGQFSDDGDPDCRACHDPRDWKPRAFDHEQQTQFPLRGAHADVACASCHPNEHDGSGGFRRFTPLPIACEACHDAARAQEDSP